MKADGQEKWLVFNLVERADGLLGDLAVVRLIVGHVQGLVREHVVSSVFKPIRWLG